MFNRCLPPLHARSCFRIALFIGVILLSLCGCRHSQRDPNTVVFLIESSPANLDPRIGTDAWSAHIDELLFDGLVKRDAHYAFTPALATSWDQPDPLTLVFHLRNDVHFHDGRALTSQDVKWTLDSMRMGKFASPKAAAYASIASIDAPDSYTVVLHLKRADNYLLSNLSTGAMGILPSGSSADFWKHPVGTGQFRFVSQHLDQDVVIERNAQSWSVVPRIARVRFLVVPDATTESLELKKGSADVAVNSLPIDTLDTLSESPNLRIEQTPGTQVQYLGFNLRDPLLKDARVRQAMACAIDRNLILRTLQRGHARPAWSLLPEGHWAYSDPGEHFDYDPARAGKLLDEAGFKKGADGVRMRLTMKTSNVEETRLLAAVLQQQFAKVGIVLETRSYESATFYADVRRGAFQIYSLRWSGGNEQPEIFGYAFATKSFSPAGANRSHYSNPRLDAILDDAAQNSDTNIRRTEYAEAQSILAHDLPAINLWSRDTIVVHNARLRNVQAAATGSFAFLETAEIASDTRQ